MSVDRLERRLPEVLTELSLPRVPDYVDDLLSRTERMSQRPGWTFLERWIPVSTYTDALSLRRPIPLRLLIAVALVLALIVAAVALYVGTQKHVPPPFGPARNGMIVSASAGDILAIDPATGASRKLIAGPHLCCSDVSPDGQHISYLRFGPLGDDDLAAMVIANVDGSTVREIPGQAIAAYDGGEWAPTGDRILVVNRSATLSIVDTATGAVTSVDLPFRAIQASWIGTTGDVLLTQQVTNTVPNGSTLDIYRLTPGATTGATLVATLQNAVDPPKVSPDGTKFLYFTWGPEPHRTGKIHVFDLAAKQDREVSPPEAPGSAHTEEWENPWWAPDSMHIAADRLTVADNYVAIISLAGGEPINVAPPPGAPAGGKCCNIIRVAPDAASVLVRYGPDATDPTYLFPISGGTGQKVSWSFGEEFSWQRLAP
jgi:hypothetical protein